MANEDEISLLSIKSYDLQSGRAQRRILVPCRRSVLDSRLEAMANYSAEGEKYRGARVTVYRNGFVATALCRRAK